MFGLGFTKNLFNTHRLLESAITFLLFSTITQFCPQSAFSVTTKEEQVFTKHLAKEKVVSITYAGGSIPYGAALLDKGDYGEWQILKLEKDKVTLVKSGRVKRGSIPLTFLGFITGDAHALISVGETKDGLSLVDIEIYDLVENPGQKLFELKDVVEPGMEVVTPTSLLVWQKDPFYLNRNSFPLKYNYFTITFFPETGEYKFGHHLHKITSVPDDDGAILNNRAVQLYLQGELKSALSKLEDASLIASGERITIGQNIRFLEAEIEALKRQGESSTERNLEEPSQNPNGAGTTPAIPPLQPFNRSKLYYLLGDYDAAVMQLDLGTGKYLPDSLALLGLSYARKKDYPNLQRVTRVLINKHYPFLNDYFEEVCKIFFYNRDLKALQAYLEVLEKANPLSPTLNYLKAAVLVDSGRLAFAKELLLKYIERADNTGSDLALVKEYLFEIASVTGDYQLAERMKREVINSVKYDLRPLAYLYGFDGTIHTEIVKVPQNVGTRFEGNFEKLEIFAPVSPETPQPPLGGQDTGQQNKD